MMPEEKRTIAQRLLETRQGRSHRGGVGARQRRRAPRGEDDRRLRRVEGLDRSRRDPRLRRRQSIGRLGEIGRRARHQPADEGLAASLPRAVEENARSSTSTTFAGRSSTARSTASRSTCISRTGPAACSAAPTTSTSTSRRSARMPVKRIMLPDTLGPAVAGAGARVRRPHRRDVSRIGISTSTATTTTASARPTRSRRRSPARTACTSP